MRQYRQAEFTTTDVRASRLTDRSRALAGAVVALALGGLGAGMLAPSAIAAAKKAQSPSVIHACYNKRTGAMRFISAGRSCGSGGVAISWSAAGVAGPPGATGEPGTLLGPRGVTGEVGPAGPPGAPGLPGEAAVRGVAGATGPTGATGPSGATGAPGKEGAKGPTGENGTTGAPGANGVTGPTGPEGHSGPPGPTGPEGKLGSTLGAGITESGTWVAASGAFPEKGREVSGVISFQVPLEKPPTVHYLTNAQSKVGTAECPSNGTIGFEKPQATSGNLCIYTGQELLTGVAFKNVQNVAGKAGEASPGGAFVIFEAPETLETNVAVVQGTWAVTG